MIGSGQHESVEYSITGPQKNSIKREMFSRCA